MPQKEIVDSVPIVVPEIGEIAIAPGAEVDQPFDWLGSRPEHRRIERMRQRNDAFRTSFIEVATTLDHELRRDHVWTDRPEPCDLGAERRPGQIDFVAHERNQAAAALLQRGDKRLDVIKRVRRAGVQNDDELGVPDAPDGLASTILGEDADHLRTKLRRREERVAPVFVI